ncbi:MAG: hypothetical protein ACI9DO_000805 [Reinekea sp.]|jgi:hypothetical protein|uniref:hypothetical protein n=1 Tax=Reinekea sp. TaxID=1970455 RepID=UPI00398904BE
MSIAELIKLNQEKLEDELSWIDWREQDTEVASLFSRFLGSSLNFSCAENDDGITISFEGIEYKIPLTNTGSDRYVVLCSCAEILKDSHHVWMYKPSLEDDTHAFLVLSNNELSTFGKNEVDWLNSYFSTLTLGLDLFNNIPIPYTNHEGRLELFLSNYQEQPSYTNNLATDSLVKGESAIAAAFRRGKLIFQALVVIVLVIFFIGKIFAPECRVKVDGECIAYYDE